MRIPLNQSPVFRLATLCVLYVAQGIPYGFVTVTLKAYLAGQKVEDASIGWIMSLCTLPWSFKWIWGPVIDTVTIRRFGRRRPWILMAQGLMSVVLAAMVFIPDLTAHIAMLGGIIFVANVFASLQDVSVDALAVDTLDESERGRANGMMYGSSYVGSIIGGAGLGFVLANSGSMRVTLAVQVAALMLIMLFPLLAKEDAERSDSQEDDGRAIERDTKQPPSGLRQIWQLFADLRIAFSLRSTLLCAVIALFVRIGSGVSSLAVVSALIKEYDWSQASYSAVDGGLALAFGLGGSILGGFLADLVGARRLAAFATVVVGCIWILMPMLGDHWGDTTFVTVFLCAEQLFLALTLVSLFAVFMGVSSPLVAATQFTAYMALMNLSTTIGTGYGGYINTYVALPITLACMGLAQAILAIIIMLVDVGETRRRIADVSPEVTM